MAKSLCSIDGCENSIHAKNLCANHYHRLKVYGDLNVSSKPRGTTEERFWKFVVKKESCWSWIGNKASGYGRISIGKHSDGYALAHRFSWELHNKKKIPEGMFVMHKCDNPECTNPDHLMIGTPKENTQDMLAKGRRRVVAPLGTENGKSVLNEEKVRFIRSSDLPHAKLAKLLEVSPSCVRGVRIGRTWAHIK